MTSIIQRVGFDCGRRGHQTARSRGFINHTVIRNYITLFHPKQHLWLRGTATSANPATEEILPSKDSTPLLTPPERNYNDNKFYQMEIGLTKRGLDDIGDVSSITTHSHHRHKEDRAEDKYVVDNKYHDDLLLCTIDWEGHSITGADELYHTVWETFERQTRIYSPIPRNSCDGGTGASQESFLGEEVEDENEDQQNTTTATSAAMYLDEDTILATMMVSSQELLMARQQKCLVDEKEYTKILRTIPPGMFAEPDDGR